MLSLSLITVYDIFQRSYAPNLLSLLTKFCSLSSFLPIIQFHKSISVNFQRLRYIWRPVSTLTNFKCVSSDQKYNLLVFSCRFITFSCVKIFFMNVIKVQQYRKNKPGKIYENGSSNGSALYSFLAGQINFYIFERIELIFMFRFLIIWLFLVGFRLSRFFKMMPIFFLHLKNLYTIRHS